MQNDDSNNKPIKIILLCAAIICAVLVCIYYMEKRNSAEEVFAEKPIQTQTPTQPPIMPSPAPTICMIKVHILGAVKVPGVYELPEGSRIQDAVSVAGGFTYRADRTALNLSKQLTDEQQIKIPEIDLSSNKEEKETPSPPPDIIVIMTAEVSIPEININTADKELLTTLPGIGDAIAGYIIEYRETNGLFQNTEEIKNVPRIGDSIYNQIKDKITV
ncbi:MAG: ComEA family DNA-binding protein [Clostridiales bacterium]|jgi:competence protein ComEA|nr:ComEA family DNA-binding protein [Clostridiales bacterium]